MRLDLCFQHGFRVLHRLDYSTSGVLLVPLTAEACRAAARAFSDRRTQKYYLAVVRGRVAGDFILISRAIGDDARPKWKNVKMCTDDHDFCQNPRPSQTKLVVLSRGSFEGCPATKVGVKRHHITDGDVIIVIPCHGRSF